MKLSIATAIVASLLTIGAATLLATAAPQPASAAHVGVDVGPGGVHIGERHRHYYDDDDYWRHHHRGAYYEHDHYRHHHED